MSHPADLAAATGAGAALGAAFFLGLWWTVRKSLASRRPVLWIVCSWMARSGLVLLAIYMIGSGSWQRIVFCLLGFAIARALVTMRLREVAAHAP